MASCLAALRQFTPPVERREDFISREGAKAQRREFVGADLGVRSFFLTRRREGAKKMLFFHAKSRRREENAFFSREGARAGRRRHVVFFPLDVWRGWVIPAAAWH
jgi:hypothetical protein